MDLIKENNVISQLSKVGHTCYGSQYYVMHQKSDMMTLIYITHSVTN